MTGWTRVRMKRLSRLLFSVREPLRWRWLPLNKKTGPKLQLVSPRGVVWDFRLSGGAWIRKAPEPNVGLAAKKAAPEILTVTTTL